MKIIILALLVILVFSDDSALDTKILVSIPQGELSKEISSIKSELAKINTAIANNEKHYKELVAALEKNQVQVKELVAALQKNQVQVKEQTAAPPSTSVSTPTSIPEQTPSVHSERLINDHGTPGASSVSGYNSPKNAFTSSDDLWSSAKNQFPAMLWMKFNNPHRLARIGYRSYYIENIPKKMIVVGSHDCTNWSNLLTIKNTGFTGTYSHSWYTEFRSWDIPAENRVLYRCIGLKWPVKSNDGYSVVVEMRMWEQI